MHNYLHHERLASENRLDESLIEQAWKEFCKKRGWVGKIEDGYTATFSAFDELGLLVYEEDIGE